MKSAKQVVGMTIGAALAVAVIYAGYALLLWRLIPSSAERGLFGDSFGALSALFSGVALVGVVGAIWLGFRQISDAQKALLADHERRRKEATLAALFSIRPRLKAMSRFLNQHAGRRQAITPALLGRLAVEEDLSAELQDYLEDFETFAMAVNSGVYDETLVREVAGPLIDVLWRRAKPYVDHYRINYPSVMNDIEILASKVGQHVAQAYRASPMTNDPTRVPESH